MPARKNRSSDLTPAGERKRKERGQDTITKAKSGEGLDIEPNPDWDKTARLVWDAGVKSGQAEFYEASDWAILYVTCEGLDHWLQQGGRKSPELLRVLMQNLNSILFSEADRRKVSVELTKPDPSDGAALAAVTALFEDEDDEEVG